MINVFVPTTPNPTSGFLLFVPKKDLHYLNMSSEAGFKMLVSTGIVTPPDTRSELQRSKPLILCEKMNKEDDANGNTDHSRSNK